MKQGFKKSKVGKLCFEGNYGSNVEYFRRMYLGVWEAERMLGVVFDKPSNEYYIADQSWVALKVWVPSRYVVGIATGEKKAFAESEAFDVKKEFIKTGKWPDGLGFGEVVETNWRKTFTGQSQNEFFWDEDPAAE